ncbi:hypothetical protein [Salinibacter sp.]|uniref:hypothetical protein n=1 Tax=Salinibacter sp. TaxID=2065818 RepID=UPI0021E82FC4|nr:hypothetical protein [Salinibacter sp.]
MGQVNVRKDRRLFVEQVGWLIRTENANLSEIVRWICVQLSEQKDADDPEDTRELRRLLVTLLRLDSQEQRHAEECLIRLLGNSFQTRSTQWKQTDVPGRNVDWSETYRRSPTSQPTQFISGYMEKQPDAELVGALRSQARQWRDLLKSSPIPGHEQRAEDLQDALDSHPFPNERSSGPLTPPLLNRLRRHGQNAEEAVNAFSRVFATRKMRPERTVVVVTEAIDEAWNERDAEAKSVWNGLLEISVLLAITQTAGQSEQWMSPQIDREGTFRATLKHETAPVTLTIRKKAPGTDVFRGMRNHMGLAGKRNLQDSQPDICLTFRHSEKEAEISVLGDAKRNATGSGTNYFRDGLRTATYYLSAFPHALGAEVVEATPWSEDNTEAFSGCIRPTVTLFFRQGVESKSEGIQAVKKPANYSEIPPVLACDIKKHFGLDNGASDCEENDTNEDWSSSFLTRWLECISEQAIEHLRKK